MLYINAKPVYMKRNTTSLREREKEQTCPINEKSRGGGEPEGWRRTERRVIPGLGGVEQVERGRENKIEAHEEQS